eukprot:GEMP01037372.1.p1 GENE.GEMP01037372.1~~GEMP01037372.1.p1  ORF type:complete len:269 (+),score=52.01 GEMP01037372.1:95-901(+)
MSEDTPFSMALLAGGCAGTSVDVALFPIDTVKTRLQAPEGFLKSGGFRGIYSGLSIAAIGSAPSAALFFSAYEGMKPVTRSAFGDNWFSHASAASVGEVIACLVRVPVEVVKQRMQAGQYKTLPEGIRAISNSPGGICTFYNGFFITVWREIPFSFIQFPLYERLKIICAERQGSETTPIQGACCGSISGGVAASVTTPLDVLKTRVMLHKDRISAVEVCKSILKNERVGALWSGVGPRTMWISIGGFVFFGAYEEAKSLLKKTSFWH